MPLAIAPIGVVLKIIKVLAELKDKKHLEDLGVTKDSEIIIISRQSGNSICLIKGCRLALDKDIARKILVA